MTNTLNSKTILGHEAKIQTFSSFAKRIRAKTRHAYPIVIAIDGRSASGKTTFANQLAQILSAPVVHTDDIAWYHSFFDWWPLLAEHILKPFRQSVAIDWIPDAWTVQARAGSIVVPIAPVLIVEGVSSSRRELSNLIDIAIWVEVNQDLAEQRGLERDGADGRDFWFEWQASEKPFLIADRPWQRAALIIDGAPQIEHDSSTQFVVLSDQLKSEN